MRSLRQRNEIPAIVSSSIISLEGNQLEVRRLRPSMAMPDYSLLGTRPLAR